MASRGDVMTSANNQSMYLHIKREHESIILKATRLTVYSE